MLGRCVVGTLCGWDVVWLNEDSSGRIDTPTGSVLISFFKLCISFLSFIASEICLLVCLNYLNCILS
jgi:hypothetical protein